jgi:hypothetical protein
MKGDKMKNIPSDEDFARAEKMMREQFRNLGVVEKNVLQHFKNRCPLHRVVILPHDSNSFEAYVFFEHDRDIPACMSNGVAQAIEDFVYEELARAGRGTRPSITIRFEFDSNENVITNYQDNYWLRLRAGLLGRVTNGAGRSSVRIASGAGKTRLPVAPQPPTTSR